MDLGGVIIFHGTDDESIPVAMSRTLAAQQKQAVRLIEIPNGRHNTLQLTHTEEIAKALKKIGESGF
ncbi:MAG: alpha/beta hydrolase [Akkermansiaceae bacterium]|nr:alpha/beta hydrolase [Akkermansiaceae bacterium]